MTVVVLTPDLIIASRVFEAGARAGVAVSRVDEPSGLPPATAVRLLLVDWGNRHPEWGERLVGWCAGAPESARPRVILFGPHTDLVAHADARARGLGPMLARSKFVMDLPTLLR